jgi:hypothetical protein
MEYDNTGKVSLWPNESDNEKAPRYKGKLFAHRAYAAGEEIALSLWNNQNANPHGPSYNEKAPRFTGRVEDKFVPQQSAQQSAQRVPPANDGFEDTEIPF